MQIQEALANDNLSVLNELLRDHDAGSIEQWAHYPVDDCIDPATGAMYYYHAHDPSDWARDEHGHFHLFVRAEADDAYSHFLAVSMSPSGMPSGLFTTNRWVTDEMLLPAAALLDRVETGFEINRARPSWLVAHWLMALVMLVRPYLEVLLFERDRALGWMNTDSVPSEVQTEDRARHVLSELPFDLMNTLLVLRKQVEQRYEVMELNAT